MLKNQSHSPSSNRNKKSKVERAGEILWILIIFTTLLLGGYLVGGYPIQQKNLVKNDKATTIQNLGTQYSTYSIDDCQQFQFLDCQTMKNLHIQEILIWQKGIDVVIIGGFDQNQQVVYHTYTDRDFVFKSS